MAVRNESVRLSLQDDFTSGMARAAAAAAALNRELNNLSGQSVATARVSKNISRDTDAIAQAATKADNSINQLTGRLRLFADAAAILGPGLVPIGAVAVPAVTGLANSLGAAALAGGVAVVAFQGVGDALKAVTKAGIEPTTENIKAARQAMEALSPAAQELVGRLEKMQPAMRALRDMSAETIMPGVMDMFDSLESRGDEVVDIFHNISAALGDMAAGAGADLASARWNDFFAFLATDVPQTLASLGRAVGDLTHGMAELWMAFDPLNDDFSSWLEDVARGFDGWATGLAQTEGFQEFIDYVEEMGPKVADTLGSLANAVIQIAQAAAPLGGPVLEGLEAVFKVISAIADSDMGTPILAAVAAMALFTRGQKALQAATATTWGTKAQANVQGMKASMSDFGTVVYRMGQSAEYASEKTKAARANVAQFTPAIRQAAGGIGAFALVASGAAEKIGVMNTATLGMVGAMSGLKYGGVLGAAAGGILDIGNALSVTADDMERFFRITSAESGGDTAAEIAAITDEIERQQKIMDDSHGLELGITKLWSSDAAAEAEERVGFLNDRLEELKLQQDEQAAAAEAGGGSLDMEAQAAQKAAQEFRNLVNALTAAKEARIANQNAILGWEQAMIDGRNAAREFNNVLGRQGQLLKGQRQEGINAKQTLLDMAGAWNAQSGAIRGNAANQRQAISAFVATATAMGMSEQAARRYARSLFDIPPKRETKVELKGADAAFAAARAIQNAINAIRGKTVYVDIIRRGGVSTSTQGGHSTPAPDALADGGPVRGPGGPRDDLVPIWASNGEYVVNAAAVSRYGREMFDLLNAQRIAGLNAFAQGGMVGRLAPSTTNSSSHIDSSRSIVVNNNGPIYTLDPNAAARAQEQRMRDAVSLMGAA